MMAKITQKRRRKKEISWFEELCVLPGELGVFS
jgi:hypothetical protein